MEETSQFYAPASRSAIERLLHRAIEHGEPYDVELEIITAKGHLRTVHSIGRADPEHRRVYGFFQDITVSITNSGPGIAETRRAKLFQPFFTTKKDGPGLGLSICRSIIEEHEGWIWEDDNPGGGATFSFSLKVRREEPA